MADTCTCWSCCGGLGVCADSNPEFAAEADALAEAGISRDTIIQMSNCARAAEQSFAEATDQLVASIGLGADELHAYATAINRHQHRTARIPEMAIQHGANRLHNPDGLPTRQLAAHQAACLAIAESVLYGVTQAGYRICRPPLLCPDHGLPRCLRCRHDGTDTP